MPVVKAEFDGKVFVPSEPVHVPSGTKVEVLVPPLRPTAEEIRQWEEITKQLDANPPKGTFDDYLRYRRGEL